MTHLGLSSIITDGEVAHFVSSERGCPLLLILCRSACEVLFAYLATEKAYTLA